MKKRSIIFLIIPFLVLVPVAFAKAVDKTEQTTAQAQLKNERIQNLKNRAEREIDRRIAKLNLLTNKINNVRRLTAAEKEAYLADINNNINELENLKTQLLDETDAVKLKEAVASITKSYRIFALYIPKIHLIAGADVVTEIVNDLNDLATKLNARIAEQEAAGKDVTELKSDLAEMQAKVADARLQADKVPAILIPLTASGYPGNKGSLREAFEALKTARADIVAAKQKSRSIIKGLKALGKTAGEKPESQE